MRPPDYVSDCGTVTLYLGDCLEIAPELVGVDAVVSDPPFSEKTHAEHDGLSTGGNDKANRSPLGYSAWSEKEVAAVAKRLPPKGWVCILTDHVLARVWESEMKKNGRCVFYPLPVIVPGRSVRLSGDGPSSWTDWLVVARTPLEKKWGTLRGFYQGNRGAIEHMGGKPLNVMCRIVEDYSRGGDVVLDFCMGAGTTGIACIRTGRKFIGIEIDSTHFATARERIERELSQLRLAL